MTQQEALDLLLLGNNVFLTGQAGSGKTYLLNRFIEFLKSKKVPVAVTASTGIAATHLGGQTIHSWAGIGIKNKLEGHDLSKIAANRSRKQRITSARILIIDEISMLHPYRLDMVDEVCRFVRQVDLPFGGLQVVLCGDFFQLPPVEDKEIPLPGFAFSAESWKKLNPKVCYLNEQHRQLDNDLLKILSDIRSNSPSENTFEKLADRLHQPLPAGVQTTRLYTHNADVDAVNNFHLSKIIGPEHKYLTTSSGNALLVEALKKGCLAPEELILKVGALVMFVKNNPGKGYINGTLGRVVGFDSGSYPIVAVGSDRQIVAEPASWTIDEDDRILAEISQIPLRLAWAITVHKSQGMTLDGAEIDLSKTFTYGMGYVALSRVRSLSGIKLLGINQTAFMVNECISEKDKDFKSLSREASSELSKLGSKKVKAAQKKYLKQLLVAADSDIPIAQTLDSLFAKFFIE